MKKNCLFFALFCVILNQEFVRADDIHIKNVVEYFSVQIGQLKQQVKEIIQLDEEIKKELSPMLKSIVSLEFEDHPVIVRAQGYLESSKSEGYLSEECQTLFKSKYDSLKAAIYEKIHGEVIGYYDELKNVLETRFVKELEEFESRVNQLYESPDDADFLTTKINKAFETISAIKEAQREIVVKKLNYFKEESSAQLIQDELFVPFTECLQNTLNKQ